jgi:hypothetical protein
MSLQNYQQLQQNSQNAKSLIGCELPKMTGAILECKSKDMTAQSVLDELKQHDFEQGWLMMSDKVVITEWPPESTYFIEGEWCNKQLTVKVKLLHDDMYRVTFMQMSSEPSTEQAYNEQCIYLRGNLCHDDSPNLAVYRQWWMLDKNENEGRWLPMVQQFCGFKRINTSGEEQ